MIDLEQLTDGVIGGKKISHEEAKNLVSAELHGLLYHSNRIRKHFKGDAVNLCSIINAKSGHCSEDCRFCAQSAMHKTNIREYPLIDSDKVYTAMENASKNGATCFSVITSGRSLSQSDVEKIGSFVKNVPDKNMKMSASLGGIDMEAMKYLKANGLKRVHHNIETAGSFFKNICTTHTFDERVATVRRAKEAGLEVCCGGILGLGESDAQRLEFAFTLQSLDVDSLPLNFLNPIAGTPLERQPRMSPNEILRWIAIFRFIMPDKEIKVCGGREVNLRGMQSWIFYAGASGMMVGGYLTTSGRNPQTDIEMIKDLGLTIKNANAC